MLALVLAKCLVFLSPILQAWAVDDLAGSRLPVFALGAVGLTITYGMARIATNGFQQSETPFLPRWPSVPYAVWS